MTENQILCLEPPSRFQQRRQPTKQPFNHTPACSGIMTRFGNSQAISSRSRFSVATTRKPRRSGAEFRGREARSFVRRFYGIGRRVGIGKKESEPSLPHLAGSRLGPCKQHAVYRRGFRKTGIMGDDPRKTYREDWRAHHDYSLGVLAPLENKATALLSFNVECGRSALRTLLELNGGGLIGLPSFAALFGSIWTRGDVWPFLAGGSLVGGLISAVTGYGFEVDPAVRTTVAGFLVGSGAVLFS
jgi:hypothetical protein